MTVLGSVVLAWLGLNLLLLVGLGARMLHERVSNRPASVPRPQTARTNVTAPALD